MPWILWGLALLAGALNTVQSGTNATLNKVLGQPVLAALAVYAGGVAGALLASPFLGLSWHGLGGRAAQVPWWGWIGGLLGAVYVLVTLTSAQKLGAGPYTALTLTAAVVTSVLLDHFGLVGFEVRSLSLLRVLGCALMVGGVVLIARY